MKPKLRSALAVITVSAIITSFHAFDLRIDSPTAVLGVNYYWLLNGALFFAGLWAGALTVGRLPFKMGAALLGLVLGLIVFATVMSARNPNNNLLPLAIAINFVVGAVFLSLGTIFGALLQRRRLPHQPLS